MSTEGNFSQFVGKQALPALFCQTINRKPTQLPAERGDTAHRPPAAAGHHRNQS